ncbi:hypothetical protein [Streptacidiphilus melanogenes]|uniref:hypothetical protein n=1 Tax=Streptacidiphilus melanogenes TaxID=411235 RepID=UPI0005AB9160|nr:hypothetical protein [Streptacidiphilus melanogenes]
MGEFEAPPTLQELMPLPRRSRFGVWCQFLAQWVLLPVGAVFALAVALLLILSDGAADIPAGEDKIKLVVYARARRGFLLPWSRCRLERVGTPAEWAAHVERTLRDTIAKVEKLDAKYNKPRPGEPFFQRPGRTIAVAAAHYRGAGIGVLADSAGPLGWYVNWPATRQAKLRTVYLSRPAGN